MPITALEREILNRAPVGMAVRRLEDRNDPGSLRLLYANAAASAMLGRDLSEDLGKTLNENNPEAARSTFAKLFAKCVIEQEDVELVAEYGDSRLQRKWWRARGTPLTKEMVLISFDDVTAQAEARKALERSNADLESFASAASHDLKSPLRDIKNLADWIIEDESENLSEVATGHVRMVQQRAARMERLLNDLLAYAQIGTKKDPVTVQSVNEVFDDIRSMLPVGNTVTVDFEPCTIRFCGSIAPLEIVLRNLVSNAIKHNKAGGRVWVRCTSSSEDCLQFDVVDDGPGIPPRFHQRIFQLFQTLQSADASSGTGMGLAICARIVEANGGDIAVESDGTNGSTFRLTWKIEEIENPP